MKKNSEIREMRALRIAQPWAECITAEGKNIENRSWNTKHRGYFLIHASSTKTLSRFARCKELYNLNFNYDDVDFGAIIAVVELADVITKKDLTRKTKK